MFPDEMPPHPPGPLTELGPIQKFSCWMYFTLSYTPLFLSTWYRGGGGGQGFLRPRVGPPGWG